LIGKNNAGKSNVMSSISNFFTCVRGGEIVDLNPPAGLELDFFDRNTAAPIATKLAFSMSADEWDSLKADLTSEAPQMKHAVEAIGGSLGLAVTVSITNQPSPFAYVSLVEIEAGGESRTVLFAVDDKAARELYRRSERINRDVSEINGLRQLTARFDADDWQRLLATGGSERPPLKSLFRRSPYFRRADVSDEALDKVDTLLSSRPTYEEFSAALKGVSIQLRNDADTVEASPLTEKVRTFAGDADSIPKYVLNLIGRIARMKVLHLRELRRQIGKEEAARLLSLKVKRGGRNVLSRIEQMIQNLLGVQVDAFESDSRGPRGAEPVAELDVDNFLVEVNGSGIRESLRLILDIEFESPNILTRVQNSSYSERVYPLVMS
jgi:putative ATP-dependent endonuclease of the OLD family